MSGAAMLAVRPKTTFAHENHAHSGVHGSEPLAHSYVGNDIESETYRLPRTRMSAHQDDAQASRNNCGQIANSIAFEDF